jgi:hypothetical protein
MAVINIKRLKALQHEFPRTRIAFVRLVWPEVDVSLNCGHSRKITRHSPANASLDIISGRLSQCVNRRRREEKCFGLSSKSRAKNL